MWNKEIYNKSCAHMQMQNSPEKQICFISYIDL